MTERAMTELDRQRERLMTLGSTYLSATELLGVVLASPFLGRTFTQAFPLANVWRDLGWDELTSLPKFSTARAAQMLALCELARRITAPSVRSGQSFSCSEEVAAAYGPFLADRGCEVFASMALDAKNCVINTREIAVGSLTRVDVHPREVFRGLIKDGAAGAIFIHNHPSGNVSPSEDDRALCARLCEVGRLIDIPILDFIIVGAENHGDGSYVSFADRGWL